MAQGSEEVRARTSNIVLVTTSDSPDVTEPMLGEPKLLTSNNSYRRPEIDAPIPDSAPWLWTDHVARPSSPGTLFETERRKSKLCPLMEGVVEGSIQNARSTRSVITTGAAWEEVVTAQLLYQRVAERAAGVEIAISPESDRSTVFCSGERLSPLSSSTRNWRVDRL